MFTNAWIQWNKLRARQAYYIQNKNEKQRKRHIFTRKIDDIVSAKSHRWEDTGKKFWTDSLKIYLSRVSAEVQYFYLKPGNENPRQRYASFRSLFIYKESREFSRQITVTWIFQQKNILCNISRNYSVYFGRFLTER